MIHIKFEDGKFLVKGTFNLGVVGIFENTDYDGNDIRVSKELDEILEELADDDSYSWGMAFESLKKVPKDGEAIAAFMTEYYNKREQGINIQQFNGNFWLKVFDMIMSTYYPLCDIEGAILEAYEGEIDNNKLESIYKAAEEEMRSLESYDGLPNDGSILKPDIEKKLRELFPFFNFDGLAKTMIREGLNFNGKKISFQCSDGWGYHLLSSAYDALDEKGKFMDWHNF